MSELLTPTTSPTDDEAPRPDPVDTAAEAEVESAASRGLWMVALLVIAIPAAIGLYVLHNGLAPPPPGAETDTPFVPSGDDGGDTGDGLTSSDLLRPSAAASGRLRYSLNGESSGLANGGTISVSPDLNVQITVDPYPPTDFATDVELVLTDGAGRPIENASVDTIWDMVMVHGPFYSTYEHVGGGTYRTDTYDFFMFGPWQLDTTIKTSDSESLVQLAVYVWPE